MKSINQTSDIDKSICVSVFKSGENITTKEAYTQLWIKLINRMEKAKV